MLCRAGSCSSPTTSVDSGGWIASRWRTGVDPDDPRQPAHPADSPVQHLDSKSLKHHDVFMRTTLTLDDDLAMQLRETARRSGESFKEVVNSAIRLGLRKADKPAPRLPRFVVEPRACGFRSGVDPRKLHQLLDELEMEDFNRELAEGSAPR